MAAKPLERHGLHLWFVFEALQPVVTICFHRMEKSSLHII